MLPAHPKATAERLPLKTTDLVCSIELQVTQGGYSCSNRGREVWEGQCVRHSVGEAVWEEQCGRGSVGWAV